MQRYQRFAAFTLAAAFMSTMGICTEVRPDWDVVSGTVKTDLTIEIWSHPAYMADSPIRLRLLKAIKDMDADYPRATFWYWFPRLSVAELDPPANGKTFWDFTHMAPLVADFMKAAEGHPVQINFSTIPQWMFKTEEPVRYPADPRERHRRYAGGRELRDPTAGEVRDYFVRLFQWYTQGGFTDEYGKRHESGLHYRFDNWEVLNEPDLEHQISPQLYTRIYDGVVGELQKIDPRMTYCGLSLSDPGIAPEYFEYFLNPANHAPGIPLDMISYHFYSLPDYDESPEQQERTTFAQVDAFAMNVRYIENIRKRLSPATKTYLNELGSFIPNSSPEEENISPVHWNLSAAMFGHLYALLMPLGIDLLGVAELNNYPGLPTEVTLTDWKTGQPNARYWAVKLMHDEIRPGDRMVGTKFEPRVQAGLFGPHAFDVQAFVTQRGARKLFIVNKRNRPLELQIAGGKGARVTYVDQGTAFKPPGERTLEGAHLKLEGYAIAFVELAKSTP